MQRTLGNILSVTVFFQIYNSDNFRDKTVTQPKRRENIRWNFKVVVNKQTNQTTSNKLKKMRQREKKNIVH